MAAENVKFQVNLKTPKGALVNLYAETETELGSHLLNLRDLIEDLVQTEELLWAAGNAGVLTVPQQAAPAGDIPPTSAPVGGKSNGADTTCQHGQRQRVAKANWVAWFCPMDKATGQQCKASFENKR